MHSEQKVFPANLKIDIDTKNSDHIKALLFKYFRFKRGYMCLTEIDLFSRDVEDFIAFKDSEIICVEVKVDRQDFLNDFKYKKKHNGEMKYNRFYFCISAELEYFVEEYLKEYPHYGILVANKREIILKRNAKKISKENLLDEKTKNRLYMRMSSELAGEKIDKLPKTQVKFGWK